MNDRRKRPRVLFIAEAANPEWTSVPLVGWSYSEALSQHVDLHLVTQVRNRKAIERQGWRHGEQFTAINSELVASPVSRIGDALRIAGLGWTTGMALFSLSYYYFEHLLRKRFGARIRAGEYDIVHRFTPLSPTVPSLIAGRCKRLGVPFVWGPINGGVAWPKGFGKVRFREGEWLSSVRNAHKLLPKHRSTRKHAAAIIIGSMTTWKQMGSQYHPKCVYIPENGIDPRRFTNFVSEPFRQPLRVAFLGRLVPLKAVDVLIEATAPLMREKKLRIDIIGDGPEQGRLESLVRQLGVVDSVDFAGWVDHSGVEERLRRAHVLGFPSIRDFGGGVVLEAMALGLVPIVADYAGPRELVNGETGYKITMGTREDLVSGFARTFDELVRDPDRIRPMGERARARVRELFTWNVKALQTCEVYRWVLDECEKPDFGMPFP